MKLLATLGAFLFSGIIAAAPLHNIIAFGDSLTDNGNLYEFMKHQLPQSPPYFEGRFSDGPIWIEYLTASLFPANPSAHLLDYAFGGAGVSEEDDDDALFTLRREINSYLMTNHDKASADSLFVVWIGANNYLAVPDDAEKALQDVNLGIAHSLQRLVDKGAKNILVLNLPDLGRTPAAIEFGSIVELTHFAHEHNRLLNNTLVELKAKHPDVNWLFFDLNKAFDHVLENPQMYGFDNITDTCANSLVNELTRKSVLRMVANTSPKQSNDACKGYLFFDLVHPTALAHEILAEKARIMLDAAGVEFSD